MKSQLFLLTTLLFACGTGSDPAISDPSAAGEAPPVSMESADGGLKLTQKTGSDGLKDGAPAFATPEGWTEQPPASAMRHKQYSLEGPEGSEPALAVVAHWPRGIGAVEPNLDTWVRQVGRDTPAAELTADERWVTESEKYLVTHLHVEGTIKPTDGMGNDIAATDSGAILAGFVEELGSEGTWTVKITGPSKTVAAHKERYQAFVAGF